MLQEGPARPLPSPPAGPRTGSLQARPAGLTRSCACRGLPQKSTFVYYDFALGCVVTLRASRQQSKRSLSHIAHYLSYCLEVFLSGSCELVHVKVRPRERVLARCVRLVETTGALADYKPLYTQSVQCVARHPCPPTVRSSLPTILPTLLDLSS
jgi:hypothetical protein